MLLSSCSPNNAWHSVDRVEAPSRQLGVRTYITGEWYEEKLHVLLVPVARASSCGPSPLHLLSPWSLLCHLLKTGCPSGLNFFKWQESCYSSKFLKIPVCCRISLTLCRSDFIWAVLSLLLWNPAKFTNSSMKPGAAILSVLMDCTRSQAPAVQWPSQLHLVVI